MILISDRDVFVGAHVSAEVKDALRLAAGRTHVSMSAFVAEAIQHKIESMGISIGHTDTHARDHHSSAA